MFVSVFLVVVYFHVSCLRIHLALYTFVYVLNYVFSKHSLRCRGTYGVVKGVLKCFPTRARLPLSRIAVVGGIKVNVQNISYH